MEQMTVFDILTNTDADTAVTKPIKMLSLFSGIGAFEKAFDHLGIPYDLVAYCEIDKHASRSYSAIHGVSEEMNLGDITKVDEKALPNDIDLITYGFPCQDISLAGKQKGLFNEDGSQTRSGLFFDALRIIEHTQPRVAIAENVKNLVGKKFKDQFRIVLDSLDRAGYNNYWKVLNAKDFGVPQNRERVFIVSIRKDIDNMAFKFPVGVRLKLRLKDILEDIVDERYYLSEQMIEGFNKHKERNELNGNGFGWNPTRGEGIAFTLKTSGGGRADDNYIINVGRINSSQDGVVVSADGIAPTHTAGHGNTPKIIDPPSVIQLANLMPTEKRKNPNQGRLYDKDGLSPTLGTMQGGSRQPFVIDEPMAYDEQNGYIREDGCVGTLTTDGRSPKHNNRVLVWDGYNQRIRADQSCVGTLTQNCGADLKRNGQGIIEPNATTMRIRKLTPKECFRLMAFDDEDFEKAEAVNSNTQLYKQAGNSIVVKVIEHIFMALTDCGAFRK